VDGQHARFVIAVEESCAGGPYFAVVWMAVDLGDGRLSIFFEKMEVDLVAFAGEVEW